MEKKEREWVSNGVLSTIFLFLIAIILFCIFGCGRTSNKGDTYFDKESIVDYAVIQYLNSGIDLSFFAQNYAPYNDYLNYGKYIKFEENNIYHLDEYGIPKVKIDGEYYYNPVTVAQYALMKYGNFINGSAPLNEFIFAADKLMSLQDSNGAFPYPFKQIFYYQENIILPPGWISCLAQGQALSVFARAYRATGDVKYISAGNASLNTLLRPIENGGVKTTLKYLNPSYDNLIVFEEYPVSPPIYTLNGFMLTIIGLYDWSNIDHPGSAQERALAKNLFDNCLLSLKTMLPYFDIGGFSVYDLGYVVYKSRPNAQVFYHAFHIQLLHILYSITQEDMFYYYEQLWQSYITPNAVNPLTLSANLESPQLKGALVNLMADMHDTNRYEYQFSTSNLYGNWQIIKYYSNEANSLLNTNGYNVGHYFVKVDVREPGSIMPRKKFRIIRYDILPPPVQDVQLTADLSNPVTIGSNITISALASGGTSEYEYRFWIKYGAEWRVVQDYSDNNVFRFETANYTQGIYYVQVDARSNGSVLYREAAKVIEINLIQY